MVDTDTQKLIGGLIVIIGLLLSQPLNAQSVHTNNQHDIKTSVTQLVMLTQKYKKDCARFVKVKSRHKNKTKNLTLSQFELSQKIESCIVKAVQRDRNYKHIYQMNGR